MESSRLKTIILLILVLVNGFLLTSLLLRRADAVSAQSRTRQELVELFAADPVAASLSPDAVSFAAPPSGQILARNSLLEQQIASALLGDGLEITDRGGGIFRGDNQLGQATFRSGGSFEITGTLLGQDAEDAARRFCRDYGYRDLTWNDGAGTAVEYYGDLPVVNCTVEFLSEDGRLISVSGTHLPDRGTETDGGTLDDATALTRFLSYCRESGAVVSAVTDTYLCYELESSAAAPMTLIPSWCIVTSASNYYVNCLTGAITHD